MSLVDGLAGRSPLASTTASIRRTGLPLSFDDPRHRAAHEWLVDEAWLLDERAWDEWLDRIADEVHYFMPVRVTAALAAGYDTSPGMAHFDEDKYSLTRRVARLRTEHAWTEDPPSRVRHHTTNVRTFAATEPGHLVAESAVLLYRSRGDVHEGSIISAGREDVLRETPDGLLLARRTILVDDSVVRIQNLAVFL